MQFFTGIGTTEPPAHVEQQIAAVCDIMASRGIGLRSGGAPGCDSLFAKYIPTSMQEIFLPWDGFNNLWAASGSHIILPEHIDPTVSVRAEAMIDQYHPCPARLGPRARLFMRRNAHQPLGRCLTDKSVMVVCWALGTVYDFDSSPPRIKNVSGGTGQAVRIAHAYGIPVFNLSNKTAIPALIEYLDASTTTSPLSSSTEDLF